MSISDGQPIATLDLSYDAPSGLYGSLSGKVVLTRDEGPKPLSVILNGGYAKALGSGLTADFGAFHSHYSHYSGFSSQRDFTEVYAGLAGRNIGGRVSVSPNYFGPARWTVHGEVDAHFDLSPNTELEGEAGLLVPLGSEGYGPNLGSQVDARLGMAHRAGPLTFHAAVSARSGDEAMYGGRGHGQVALILGLSSTW